VADEVDVRVVVDVADLAAGVDAEAAAEVMEAVGAGGARTSPGIFTIRTDLEAATRVAAFLSPPRAVS
jgi:hypothetical protein